MKQIKNVIFDLDGTLVDASIVTVSACLSAAADMGLPAADTGRIVDLIGCGGLDYYRKLYQGYDDSVLIPYAREVERRELQKIAEYGKKLLFPGVEKLLCTLKDAGSTIALASTGHYEYVYTMLQETGIREFFSVVKCGHNNKVSMVKEIIGTKPQCDWLMVGDKQFDLVAGKENGLPAIAAKYGYGTKKEIEGFDAFLNEPLDLVYIMDIQRCYDD